MRVLINKAKSNPKRLVFPEGDEDKILRAAAILVDEEIAVPILLGNVEQIRARARELNLELGATQIIDPRQVRPSSRSMPRNSSPCASARGLPWPRRVA